MKHLKKEFMVSTTQSKAKYPPSLPSTTIQSERGREWHLSPISCHVLNTNKHIASQEPADPPPHKKTPPYLNGQTPAGTQAKAHDYEQGVCQLIIEACQEFEVRIVTTEPSPDPEKLLLWARECWVHACEEVDADYSLPDRIITIVMFIR